MNDRERLLQWMASNSINAKTLAEKMDVAPSEVSMVTTGARSASTRFKWHFGGAFGFDAATEIFADDPIVQMREAV